MMMHQPLLLATVAAAVLASATAAAQPLEKDIDTSRGPASELYIRKRPPNPVAPVLSPELKTLLASTEKKRDDKRLATMTYSIAGATRVIIDHTEVSDELRGAGAGGRLVEAAVQWARQEKKMIFPLCPFARSVFEKTPAYKDVLLR